MPDILCQMNSTILLQSIHAHHIEPDILTLEWINRTYGPDSKNNLGKGKTAKDGLPNGSVKPKNNST